MAVPAMGTGKTTAKSGEFTAIAHGTEVPKPGGHKFLSNKSMAQEKFRDICIGQEKT
ncbi:MAG: hypothetical protein JXR75_07945 [Rhodobacteraceae bacterium]|nr:hypothetical protein [Paracoccaceae bacterium]